LSLWAQKKKRGVGNPFQLTALEEKKKKKGDRAAPNKRLGGEKKIQKTTQSE